MTLPPAVRVRWDQTYRIIRSRFPPIHLFEDIANPADWDLLISAEQKVNPRLNDTIGRLDLVPPDRRVGGAGSSQVMAPFVHVSTDRPSRFSRGAYGVYYAGDSEAVAIAETAHHHARTMAATSEPPGWTSQFRMLIGAIDAELVDVAAIPGVLHPTDYTAAQDWGARIRDAGGDGVLYPSVRFPDGQCFGAFYPDVVSIPVQGDHFDYHWDGSRVDRCRHSADHRRVFRVGDPISK